MAEITKYGAAYMAASQLTSRPHVQTLVAAQYVSWIDDQVSEELAINALLGAMRSSKNSDRVLVRANQLYTEIPAVDQADDPSIDEISPDTGHVAGGLTVTISGSNLGKTLSVTFDDVEGTDLEVISDSEVTVKTPAGSAGAVDVVLTAENGEVEVENGFTYVDMTPVIDTVTPSSGDVAGGDTVVIAGSFLTGATSVKFGDAEADFDVVDDDEIEAVAPAGSAGAVTVAVTTPYGTGTKSNGYTYVE